MMQQTVSATPRMRVRYSYLPQQFAQPEEIFVAIREHLRTCRFTLGPEVEQFECAFADLIGTRYAIGVGSGTEALTLSLRALQRGLAHLGYRRGDFPETERQAASLLTLPVDQHLSQDQLQYVIDMVTHFYEGNGHATA